MKQYTTIELSIRDLVNMLKPVLDKERLIFYQWKVMNGNNVALENTADFAHTVKIRISVDRELSIADSPVAKAILDGTRNISLEL